MLSINGWVGYGTHNLLLSSLEQLWSFLSSVTARDPDPYPVMAGVVARIVEKFGKRDIWYRISLISIPVSSVLIVLGNMELARIREEKKLLKERFDQLRARGIIRDQ
ncbi:hypothetical protein ISN45_At05g005370 [Arabidopsis thaliana x Arabidopsis arenosa]|uniref:Uncharacterized protein n=1 Tax=Arabidopsis thaliana x Arabidopsis arenosa TaxID=1240361 RepID=A0A8T2D2Y4_9BRAS|nr:hypothetical protein ISN45_At05g005370 [Arabidopsis thaliana x Arabidopsis arenosa]